jgi:hypothetical protein
MVFAVNRCLFICLFVHSSIPLIAESSQKKEFHADNNNLFAPEYDHKSNSLKSTLHAMRSTISQRSVTFWRLDSLAIAILLSVLELGIPGAALLYSAVSHVWASPNPLQKPGTKFNRAAIYEAEIAHRDIATE